MNKLKVATVALCATAATVVGGGTARADTGNSDAAHACPDGLQVVEYVIDGQHGLEAAVDFGSLSHGFGGFADLTVRGDAWVVTDGHGQCVSLFAAAKKGTKSGGKVVIHDIQIVKTFDVSSPVL